MFQFLMVQLIPGTPMPPAELPPFQFLTVRLKDCSVIHIRYITRVSIPFDAIKRRISPTIFVFRCVVSIPFDAIKSVGVPARHGRYTVSIPFDAIKRA